MEGKRRYENLRIGRAELESLLTGYGYRPYVVEGDEPAPMHRAMAATLDAIRDFRDTYIGLGPEPLPLSVPE